MEGWILDEVWEVRRCIGRGTFCELYVGCNVHTGELVAIKFQNASIEGPVVKYEADVLKALDKSMTGSVPSYIYSGHVDRKDYLIMELLGGEDMGKLRNRLRKDANDAVSMIPFSTAVYFATEISRLLKELHFSGYVHRDVKPSNFVREKSDSKRFRIIDFGVTRRYKDRDGKVIARRERAEFRGTTFYASINSHNFEDLSPRDDLWSMVYVFLDILCGSLPWSEAAKLKEKERVRILKEEYARESNKLIEWIQYTRGEQVENFSERKLSIMNLVEHIRQLSYEDMPDYDLVETCFRSMMDMDECKLHFNGVNLSAGNDTFKYVSYESITGEIIQNELRCRLNVINRLCRDTCTDEDMPDSGLPLIPRFFGRIVDEKIFHDLLIKFGRLCKELVMKVKESEIKRETSDFFWESIRKQQRFFHYRSVNMNQMAEFLTMQADIQAFIEVREVIMERPPEVTSFHVGDKKRKFDAF